MNQSIQISTQGQGRGTIVTLNSKVVPDVFSVEIQIEASGVPLLKISQFVKDGNGNYMFEGVDRIIKTRSLVFRGHLEFTGEALAEATG